MGKRPEATEQEIAACDRGFDQPLSGLIGLILVGAHRVGAVTLEDFEVYHLDFKKAATVEEEKAATRKWLERVLAKLLAMTAAQSTID